VSYNLANGMQRILVHQTRASSVTVDGPFVYYDGNPQPGQVDVYRVRADASGPPERLTTTGRVALPFARNGAITWQEPQQGPAQSEWIMPIEPIGMPRMLDTSHAGNARPGNGFAIWLSDDGSSLMGEARAGPRFVIGAQNLSISARWAVSGNEVAWATSGLKDLSATTIHVGTVITG
jgi:hypothetical protein